jgi:hypothetical protein
MLLKWMIRILKSFGGGKFNQKQSVGFRGNLSSKLRRNSFIGFHPSEDGVFCVSQLTFIHKFLGKVSVSKPQYSCMKVENMACWDRNTPEKELQWETISLSSFQVFRARQSETQFSLADVMM